MAQMGKVKTTLESAFDLPPGMKDARDIVRNLNFSKTVDKKRTQAFAGHRLAPAFGTLTKESLKMMDRELVVVMGPATLAIAGLPEKTWEKVTKVMLDQDYLEPMGEDIRRGDKLIKDGVSAFKFDGSPDPVIVNEVNAWFINFIKDEDILKSTGLDVKMLAEVVASSGARVSSVDTALYRGEYHEETAIEIGVLRYPDLDQPYFKLYKIELKVWSDCTRILMVQNDSNGITGDLCVRKFRPRKSILDGISEKARQKAIAQTEAIFDGLG